MNERIPILYDMKLRPEWIDFALEQYLKCPDEATHRKVLSEYLNTQIGGKEVLIKTVRQLQRNVGYRSCVSRARLEELYKEMGQLSSDERTTIRLRILEESTPFFADCVSTLRKLRDLGITHIPSRQLEERLISRYGERETVHRRLGYVLQTLSMLGIVAYNEHEWHILSLPEYSS